MRPRAKQTLLNVGALFTVLSPLLAEDYKLEEVATFPVQQVPGVTVSAKGRVFVNFWSDDHTTSVAEIIYGKPVPYPDEAWNTKKGEPDKRWVCVQSVVVPMTTWLGSPVATSLWPPPRYIGCRNIMVV